MSVHDKLNKISGSHKLLALDGGGIRGIITLEILTEIEDILRQAYGDDTFVLADYFDYIAGTSTGAIIATCLSLGMPVKDIYDLYTIYGKEMFKKVPLWKRFRHRYKRSGLATLLSQVIGVETTLGDDKLKTLLMLVLRNEKTDSPWFMSNNPYAKYNDHQRSDCNLNIPLWQLVRASTAAPTYFSAETIKVGKQEFHFVDGGVTVYNNPAFQLFLMATVEPYRLNWLVGEKNMLLVSIGTGTTAAPNPKLRRHQLHLLFNARSVPAALMYSAMIEQDFLCRVFGKCLFGARTAIDREIGDLIRTKGPVEPRLFTYVRYTADLSSEGLAALGLSKIRPKDIQRLDSVNHINELRQVGVAIAKDVDLSHFVGFL